MEAYTYTMNADGWSMATATARKETRSARPRAARVPAVTLEEAFASKYPEWAFILGLFREACGCRATWKNLTKSNLCRFVDFMQGRFAPNTANQYAVRLKAVLNMYSEEIRLPADYARILSPRKTASTAVYLDESELAALEAYEPGDDNERYVRGMFLISAYTGARLVDATGLNASNIRDGELVFIARKTHKEARIPLKPSVARYIEETPRVNISDVSYNAIIRRICRRVGITASVKICRAGKEVELAKCDAVSSHTARRSFATNLYLRGVDLYTISRLCQHSNVELTKKYICADIRRLDASAMEYFN